MQTQQLQNNLDVLKTIFISYIIVTSSVSNFVYAREQSYIYPSDIIANRTNSYFGLQQKSYYQEERPDNFYKHLKEYRNYYKYPPPIQKPGSNPITNPQHKYQFPSEFNNNLR